MTAVAVLLVIFPSAIHLGIYFPIKPARSVLQVLTVNLTIIIDMAVALVKFMYLVSTPAHAK